MDRRNSETRWVGGERSPRGVSPDATPGEGDPGGAPAAPLQSPSFQGSRGSIGPPGGHARAPGPLWHAATSSHVWDQCHCLSASQAPPPLICARHTFPTSQIVSGIRPSPLSTYPCRTRLPWGRSGATLRTPWCGIMQTIGMEADLGRPPGGGGLCVELKRSKTPVSWSLAALRPSATPAGGSKPRGGGRSRPDNCVCCVFVDGSREEAGRDL